VSIWRWAALLNELDHITPEARITLGEGDTPLLHSRQIGPGAGLDGLLFKLETTNPSGSYKDRFAAAAVSDMVARGKTRCIATSSGNTGAALAAYCAALPELDCELAVLDTTPAGKLHQMIAYGARVNRVRGFGVDPDITSRVMEHLRTLADRPDAALQISAFHFSPIGMSGVETISFELAEQATHGIDHVFVPVGGGGLALAVARGFARLQQQGRLARPVSVHCVQPDGNDTIASPLRDGSERAHDVTCTSQISGLQVANVIDGHETIAACRASGGTGHLVSDESVWQVQACLAQKEGVYCEPAGAVALAGALDAAERGIIDRQGNIVCLVTGSAFKDPPSVQRMIADVETPVICIDELQRQAIRK